MPPSSRSRAPASAPPTAAAAASIETTTRSKKTNGKSITEEEEKVQEEGVEVEEGRRNIKQEALPPLLPLATPAKVKSSSSLLTAPTPSTAAPSRKPVPPTPSTSKAVPPTPSRSSAASTPPPPFTTSILPPRPTSFSSTDPSFLTAIDRMLSKVDAVACGFAPQKGPVIDVEGLYQRLAKVTKVVELAEMSHQLGQYCDREGKHPPASQLHTLAGQYYRACKTLKHMEMEMEYANAWSLLQHAAHPPSSSSPSSASPDLTPSYDRFEKLIQSCLELAPKSTPLFIEFSYQRLILRALAEMAHTELVRGLAAIRMEDQMKVERSIGNARGYWKRFITMMQQLNPLGQLEYTAAELAGCSSCLMSVVDDFFTLLYCAQLLKRYGDSEDYWGQLSIEILEGEVKNCANISRDANLSRWRLAKLLQTTQGNEEQRKKWRKELQALIVSPPSAASSKPKSSSSTPPFLSCFSRLSVGPLLSLLEQCFISATLHLSASEVSTLKNQLVVAMKALSTPPPPSPSSSSSSSPLSEAEIMHAKGIFQLARSFLCINQKELYPSSYTAYFAFKLMLRSLNPSSPSTSSPAPSSSPVSSSTPPRFSFLTSYLRCLYIRGVLEEVQGGHKQALEMFKMATTTIQTVFYQQIGNNGSEKKGIIHEEKKDDGEKNEVSKPIYSPFASVASGEMHRSRICSKLDRWDQVKEILQLYGMMEGGIDSNGAQLEALSSSSVPFLSSFGVHTGELQRLIHTCKEKEGEDDDDLSKQMKQMSVEEEEHVDTPCTTCQMCSDGSSPSPFTSCLIDALLSQLQNPSFSPPLAEVQGLLETHSLVRHPPLMRLLHQRAAKLFAREENQIDKVLFHLHQSMAVAARHEVNIANYKRSQTQPDASDASPRASYTLTSFAEEFTYFQSTFLPSLPPSWRLCSIDLDPVSNELLLSTCAWGAGKKQQQKNEVKDEEMQEEKKKKGAPKKKATSAKAKKDAASVSTSSDTSSSPSVTYHRILSAPSSDLSLSSIRSSFASFLKLANEASQLSTEFNQRLLPQAKAAAASKAEGSKEKSRQAKAVLDSIEPKRIEADEGIQRCCEQLERLIGDEAIESMVAGEVDEPIIFVISSSLSSLPWENMPRLRNRCITRMNSWRFLLPHLQSLSSPPSSSLSVFPPPSSPLPGYYVLNPQNNIVRVSSTFWEDFQKRGWKGSCGAPTDPTHREEVTTPWMEALQRSELFIYVGHNNGQEFVKPKQIRELLERGADVKAVALQSGCSSALQTVSRESGPHPLYESSGLSLAYQQAHCPAMFGCLWNVTDDIDRWLKAFIDGMDEDREKGEGGKTLQQISLQAKTACQKRFINGAAVVCYGLPIKTV